MVEIVDMALPDAPCQCEGHPLAADGCICPRDERALRAWKSGALTEPMTADQRNWCLDEIGRVEGWNRDEHLEDGDAELAGGVISAWVDFCRDKGLM